MATTPNTGDRLPAIVPSGLMVTVDGAVRTPNVDRTMNVDLFDGQVGQVMRGVRDQHDMTIFVVKVQFLGRDQHVVLPRHMLKVA